MIPNEPPRNPQMGFLYVPPFRVQGISIAGEQSVVQVPELDICFDIGSAPKAVLPTPFVALSHGHMDHVAGIAYYFSQRHFQDMPPGTVVAHPDLAPHLEALMQAWAPVENQRTPHRILGLAPDTQIPIKNNIFLRAIQTVHTVPSLGFVVHEQRSKLREQFIGLPQERLVQLKQQGTEITQMHEIPLVCYTGDTAWGPHFERQDVLAARILITECTFLERGHRDRANIGKHLHLDHIIDLCETSSAEAIILTHLSRRTQIHAVRRTIEQALPERHRDRVLVLMDVRTNRRRYEQQMAEVQAKAD